MIRALLAITLCASPSIAEGAHMPYKYREVCHINLGSIVVVDMCTIVDTRDNKGGLRSRGVFSSRANYAHKMTWQENHAKYTSWNSIDGINNPTKVEYKSVSGEGFSGQWTQIDRRTIIRQISWD